MSATPEWFVTGASVLGSVHARAGVDCQDSFAVRQEGATLVLASADGGSRAHLAGTASALAATIAADEAWARMPTCTGSFGTAAGTAAWTAYLEAVVRAVVDRFGAAAGALKRALGDHRDYGTGQYSTTLTVAAVRHPWLAVAAIGDGFVVTRRGDRQLDLLLPPDDDTPVPAPGTAAGTGTPFVPAEPGRTVFLDSPGSARRVRRAVARLPDLTGLALSTDGLREVGLVHERGRSTVPYDGFFTPLFAHAARAEADDTFLARFLTGPRVTELVGDDKTLLVAVGR